MCKRAEDLMPLLRVIAGPDGIDEKCRSITLGDPNTVDVTKLNFYSIRNGPSRFFFKKVSKDITAAQEKAENYLKSIGAKVTVIDYLPELEESLEIWSACLSQAGNDDFAFLMGNSVSHVSSLWEFIQWCLDIPNHTFPAIGLSIIEKIPKLQPHRTQKFALKVKQVKAALASRLGSNGVMLYPTYPEPAPKHHKALLPPFNWVYTAIFNVLEYPVTQVPLGLNPQGIPLGIQVVALPGYDAVTIAVAMQLDKKFGWISPA